MTDDKTDAGPERGDGEVRGVSDGEPRGLPSWARQPMIDSGPSNSGHYLLTDPPQYVGPSATLSRNPNIPEGARVVVGSTTARPKHRIVHAWHIEAGYLFVLGSDGRILWHENNAWHEVTTYPPGLEP